MNLIKKILETSYFIFSLLFISLFMVFFTIAWFFISIIEILSKWNDNKKLIILQKSDQINKNKRIYTKEGLKKIK